MFLQWNNLILSLKNKFFNIDHRFDYFLKGLDDKIYVPKFCQNILQCFGYFEKHYF